MRFAIFFFLFLVSQNLQASNCPAEKGRLELVSTASWQQAGSPVAFCLYGSKDTNVTWIYSLYRLRGDELLEMAYPPAAEGLGMFSQREIQLIVPTPIDLNFDGEQDVSLLAYLGGTGNSGHHYWVYDPESGTYDYNELLSGRSVELDEARQMLRSSYVGGHAGAIRQVETFRWIDDQVVINHVERSDWNAEQQCYQYTVSERRKGKLVVLHESCKKSPP